MNERKVKDILFISKKIRPLIQAVGQMRQVAISIKDEQEALTLLNKSIEKIEYRILLAKSKIKNIFCSLSGWDERLLSIDYISIADIEDRFVYSGSINNISRYLDLNTGEFVLVDDVPNELHN